MNVGSKKQKNASNGTDLVLSGIFFLMVGFTALFNPKFDFRGSVVDLTGYNIEAGLLLIVFGIVSIVFGLRRKKPDKIVTGMNTDKHG